jgi:hypothetical protein
MNRFRVTSLTCLRQIIYQNATAEIRMGSVALQEKSQTSYIDRIDAFQWQQQRFMAVPKKKVQQTSYLLSCSRCPVEGDHCTIVHPTSVHLNANR